MTHDVVIRGGTVVDGWGGEPYMADIAISGDKIAEIGSITEAGRREIDAYGLSVTPGFVDLHTHLDAQIAWDPQVTSITWHGVTTSLLGNCGVTFAPCKPKDRETLAAMMETVEDIPKRAILHGLPWNWETYGEYLDCLETLNPAINIAGMVGHCALRFYVMGERAVEEPEGYTRGWTPLRRPSADEVQQIAALAAQSVAEGAVGFSTNRMQFHRLPDGRAIPGTFARLSELREIAKAIGKRGIMQTVSGWLDFEAEFDLLAEEARLTRGVLYSAAVEAGVEAQDARVRAMRAEGLNVASVTVPRSGGGLSGLQTRAPFDSSPWRELLAKKFEDRLAAIRNPVTRTRLIDAEKQAGDGRGAQRWFWMGKEARPNYAHALNESVWDMANAAREHPVETWLRLTDETDGRGWFHMRGFNVDLEGVEQLIKNDWIVPAQGDAGAHVSQMVDSGCTSFVLSHWVRDRGLFTFPDAIRRLTSNPAQFLGLADRGSLEVGKKADINVIDPDNVAECQPEVVRDMPFEAPRFIQRGVGYHATLCNGEVILQNDELTGERPGRVIRSTD